MSVDPLLEFEVHECVRPHHGEHDPTLEPCPECRVGKCGNCDGSTWDDVRDEPAPCPCWMAGHE
jgi:hypothetical protein